MAWIAPNSGETASSFKSRLDTLGAGVTVSDEKTSCFVSASASSPLRQITAVTVTEYRGITEAGAILLRGLTADTTTHATYYASAGTTFLGKSDYVSATATTGTLTSVSSSRADDTGQWKARVTVTTYSADGSESWTSTKPTSRSTAGTVTQKSVTRERKEFRDSGVTYGTRMLVHTTTVTEYGYLTQSAASAKCEGATDTLTTNTISLANGGVTKEFEYETGTTTSYSMRFVSNEEGYTVTKTETVISDPTAATT